MRLPKKVRNPGTSNKTPREKRPSRPNRAIKKSVNYTMRTSLPSPPMTGPRSLSAISGPIAQSCLFSFHDPLEQSSNMITQVRVIRFLGLKKYVRNVLPRSLPKSCQTAWTFTNNVNIVYSSLLLITELTSANDHIQNYGVKLIL